jgi:SAM-dependent methyltransferase
MSFKDHFSGHAAGYQAARPTYSEALFDWLAATAPARALAWDVGCGNGQASVALAARFVRVHGSDPSAEQIAHAEARANIDYRVEPSEHCSLPDRCADVVTVAQALHWFDLEAFYREVRRVAKPGGIFAAWAYADCRTGVAEIDALKDHVYVDLTAPYWPPERALVETGYRSLPFPFEAIAAPPFEMVVTWTADQYLAYLRSWSGTQRYMKAKGEDPVAAIDAELRKAWGGADERRPVRWDLYLRCGRV